MKNLIIKIIIIILSLFTILLTFFVNSDMATKYKNNNKNTQKNEQKKLIFKNISFVDETNISMIKFYDNKYILANNTLYDLEGNILFKNKDYDFIQYEHGYIIVNKENKSGILGKDYKELIPVKYYDIEIISDECFLLETVNKNSNILTTIYNPKSKKEYGPFNSVSYFTDELIIVTKKREETFGYDTYSLNIKNDKIEKTKKYDNLIFSSYNNFKSNYIISDKITDSGFKTGVIDFKGKEIVPFKYDDLINIDDKLLLAKHDDDSSDIIDINNKKILTTSDVEDVYLEENILEIEKSNENFEYYDLNGKLLYKTNEFSSIDYINDNIYILDTYDKCIYMDLSNNDINKKEIDYSYCKSLFGRDERGYIIRENETGQTLHNNKLEQVFQNEYDYINTFDNFCLVEKENVYKVISYSEEQLVDLEFKNYKIISNNELLLFDKDYNKYYFKY